jgi:hypothetical protein
MDQGFGTNEYDFNLRSAAALGMEGRREPRPIH